MKKLMALVVLAAVAAGGAFALPEFKLSAGAGGYFTSDFGGGVENSDTAMEMPYVGGGAFAFFDATYAELSLGFFGGGGEMKMDDGTMKLSYMGLDIGLLGKYPVTLSEKMTVFPLAGITYRAMLSVKDEDGNAPPFGEAGDFSALWFKLGGGLDFDLTDQLYLRGGILYGLRLASKFEKDMKDMFKENMGADDMKPRLGHGLEVKIAVGYRF